MPRLRYRYFSTFQERIINLMGVSTNKQTNKQLVNMKHFFLVLSRLWQGKDYMALSQLK